MKQTIKLTENELTKVIKESVKNFVNEADKSEIFSFRIDVVNCIEDALDKQFDHVIYSPEARTFSFNCPFNEDISAEVIMRFYQC